MIPIMLNAAGGLGLFLLAMAMMTDGLKAAGGQGLRSLLDDWTSNAVRGVFSGALVTAIVQSSSAVTVATIGFVNAGVLSLRQALGVVFGANVGTTMTGWLVSFVGPGLRIETLALPLLAAGVALSMLARGRPLKGLGSAVAGFGLFFLGLAVLRDAFSGIAASLGPDWVDTRGDWVGLLGFVGIGIVATVLTQSSSAAIALILTAAGESVIATDAAAAAIIGTNIGTTSTAVLAAIGATPNAKRVAAGHVVFNVVTGAVALALLPAIVAAGLLNDALPEGAQAHGLPIFHSALNIAGVCIMLPLTVPLANVLQRLFRTQEEDLACPRFLDRTVLHTPALAIAALYQELDRLSATVHSLVASALGATAMHPAEIERRSGAVYALGGAIGEFATAIRMESLPRDVAERLPGALRITRYLEQAARLAPRAAELRDRCRERAAQPASRAVEHCLATAVSGLATPPDEAGTTTAARREEALRDFQDAYQTAKSALLHAAVGRAVGIDDFEALTDALSQTRRMVEQLAKADRALEAARDRGQGTAGSSGAPGPAGDFRDASGGVARGDRHDA